MIYSKQNVVKYELQKIYTYMYIYINNTEHSNVDKYEINSNKTVL